MASKNPFDKPIIDPQYVSTTFDKFCLREAVKAIKRFVSARAWADYIISPHGSAAATTDEEIDAHIRGIATTVYHATGTASMSAGNAHWGVVNPDLKVKGVEGIRIVDASVFVNGFPVTSSYFDVLTCRISFSRCLRMRIPKDRYIYLRREQPLLLRLNTKIYIMWVDHDGLAY